MWQVQGLVINQAFDSLEPLMYVMVLSHKKHLGICISMTFLVLVWLGPHALKALWIFWSSDYHFYI